MCSLILCQRNIFLPMVHFPIFDSFPPPPMTNVCIISGRTIRQSPPTAIVLPDYQVITEGTELNNTGKNLLNGGNPRSPLLMSKQLEGTAC